MNLEVSVVYSSFPRKRRAVRGIELGCELTLVCNQRVSPWPGWTRPPTPSMRTLRLRQDVDARDKPGQGAFGGEITTRPRSNFPRIALPQAGRAVLTAPSPRSCGERVGVRGRVLLALAASKLSLAGGSDRSSELLP